MSDKVGWNSWIKRKNLESSRLEINLFKKKLVILNHKGSTSKISVCGTSAVAIGGGVQGGFAPNNFLEVIFFPKIDYFAFKFYLYLDDCSFSSAFLVVSLNLCP